MDSTNSSNHCDSSSSNNISGCVNISARDWSDILTAIILSLIIIITIVGNILVILSVFTYKPLRIVQNFFIVSLAVADLTVAVLVLPLNVANMMFAGQWVFGMPLCKMWLTCDILCCTASILNLCAIALDRYWAITDPINYAQQRTLNRVMIMIGGVWVLSVIISSPPLLGWNDWTDSVDQVCQLSSKQGYVVYSALGSFYIPLFIMTIVYIEIFIATRRRLRERANASKLNMVKQNNVTTSLPAAVIAPKGQDPHPTADQDSVSSEANHNEHPQVEELPSGKTKEKKKKKKPKNKIAEEKAKFLSPMLVMDDSITDNADSASGSNHRNSLNHAEDGHTTTTNTESPKSRTQDPTSPAQVEIAVPPVKKPIVVYQFIEEKQRISLSKERRAARTLGIIMGVFVVCWLPFFLMYVIVPFCVNCTPSPMLINFITWLGYINSGLNPIIYTIFNLDFRRAFKKLLHMKA